MIFANVALPSFVPHSVATLVGILVIAGIEGWFISRFLRMHYCESFKKSVSANFMSTVAGVPMAWLLWMIGVLPVTIGIAALGIEIHPVILSTVTQSAFVGGFIPDEWTNVGSAGAWILALVPFWFGSIWIERRTLQKLLPDCDRALLRKAVVRGNLATYSVFLIFGLVALGDAIEELPERKNRFREDTDRQIQRSSGL